MADDDTGRLGGQRARRAQHVFDQRQAGQVVQHLGPARPHPCPLPGREDQDVISHTHLWPNHPDSQLYAV